MGVVLLELFHGSALEAWKDKHALAQLEEIKKKLSVRPAGLQLAALLSPSSSPHLRCSACGPLHAMRCLNIRCPRGGLLVRMNV